MPLSYDARSVFSLFSMKYMGSCPLNRNVSDASQSHAFVYKVDGSFEYVRGFEFDEEQAKGGSGHRELLAIRLALSLDAEQFRKQTATKIFWQTDSRNCFNFLTRGSRRPAIRKDSSLSVYFIKLSTTNYCTHTSINITPISPSRW